MKPLRISIFLALPLTVIVSMIILTTTLFKCVHLDLSKEGNVYDLVLPSILIYFIAIQLLNYFSLHHLSSMRRTGIATALSLIETFAFTYCVMFFLLNTYGS